MTTDDAGMEVLDADACRQLLRAHPHHVGRVGIVDDGGVPAVLPFNFRLDGDDVILRTGEGELLAAVRAGRPVAFEVDHVDPAWQDGWSVLIQGQAEEISDTAELERVQRLPLRAWAPGQKSYWLRLPTAQMTGRRIV